MPNRSSPNRNNSSPFLAGGKRGSFTKNGATETVSDSTCGGNDIFVDETVHATHSGSRATSAGRKFRDSISQNPDDDSFPRKHQLSTKTKHGKLAGGIRLTSKLNNKVSNIVSHLDQSGGRVPVPRTVGAAKIVLGLGETVTTVVMSADKQYFAAGAINKVAKVCEVESGDVVAEFTADGQITASAFGGVGQHARLIVGTFTGNITVFHVASNRAEHTEKFGTGATGDMVTCMAISGNATKLAVGGKSLSVLIYALSLTDMVIGMNVIRSFDVKHTGTLSISIDADCKKLVVGGESKIVKLWEVAQGDEIQKPPFQFRTSTITHSVAINAGGTALAVGTSEHTEIYRLVRQEGAKGPLEKEQVSFFCEPLQVLECPATQGGVAFSKLSQLAIGGNQKVFVFDVQTGGMLVQIERDERVRCVAISGDGESLLLGGFDKTCCMLQINRGCNFYDLSGGSDGHVCKSVHLSADSKLLAMGLDVRGTGLVQLHDATTHVLKKEWEHPKAMWAVRISSDSKLLAAGGWDMALTLYSTTTYDCLQKIKYTPVGGPAFIWSLEWSQDSSRLSLGCWDSHAYVYIVDKEGQLAVDAEGAQTWIHLHEVCKIKRADRVYAVALDAKGSFVVVGGRDKRVAMYDIDRGEGGNILSHDGAEVQSSFKPTGPIDANCMWDVLSEDFVYCVALSSDMQYVAYGGTAKKVNVLSAISGTQLFDVPQSGVVWSVALKHTSKGWKLAIGGELTVISIINVEAQTDELQLPVNETTFDISMRDDAIAYANGNRGTMFGAGGARCSWQEQPSFRIITGIILSLLSVEDQMVRSMQLLVDRHPALINARDEVNGSGLLHFVIERTNQPALLSLLLNADCRLALPRDKNGRSPLQLAVQHGKWRSLQQLLEAVIMKRFSFTPGPMGIIAENMRETAYKYPLEYLKFISSIELQPEPEVLGEIDASDVMLPQRLVSGSHLRCPKGHWNEQLQNYRVTVQSDDATTSDGLNEQSSVASPLRRQSMAIGAMRKRKSVPTLEQAVEIGYSTVVHTGVQAFRVPFEDFAALAEPGGSCPLQLIIEAVGLASRSGGEAYSVFGSVLMEILLEYKWRGFARRKYTVELILYLAHVVIILIWNIRSQAVLDQGYTVGTIIDGLMEGDGTLLLLASLWVWTTVMCINFTRLQIMETINVGFLPYISDPWNALEIVYVICQLLVNVLFLAGSGIDGAVVLKGVVPAYNQTLLESFGGRRLDMLDPLMPDVWPDGAADDAGFHRMLRGGGGSSKGGVGGGSVLQSTADALYPYGAPTGNRPGAYVILQCLVAWSTWVRLLYYFKGILRLGTLVHTMQRIFVDIYPLGVLIVVIFMAFWSSMWMLIQVELVAEYSKEWSGAFSSIVRTINMGLYTDLDAKLTSYQRFEVLVVLYEVYMFIVQIILLNMLIALMAESNERVRAIAKLVAQFERAKLILQWERRLGDLPHSRSNFARIMRFVSGLPSKSGKKAAAEIFPKWLHVLMPSAGLGSKDDEAGPEGVAIKLARDSMQQSQDGYNKLAKAVATSQEETKRLATLVVETQEKHGNALRDLAKEMSLLRSQGASSGNQTLANATRNLMSGMKGVPLISKPMVDITLGATSPDKRSDSLDTTKSDSGLSTSFSWFGNIFAGDKNENGTTIPASDRAGAGRRTSISRKEMNMAARRSHMAKPSAPPTVPPSSVGQASGTMTTVNHAKHALPNQMVTVHEEQPEPAKNHHTCRRKDSHKASIVPKIGGLPNKSSSGVPIPTPLPHPIQDAGDPAAVFKQMQAACGKPVNFDKVRKVASSMRNPEYTLRAFHEDVVVAFPELRYYLLAKPQKKAEKPSPGEARKTKLVDNQTNSGFKGGDTEYLRTIGAFHAIYWLARIGIDGERGFSFGVDESNYNWPPLVAPVDSNTGKPMTPSSLSKVIDHSDIDPHVLFFSMGSVERAVAFYQNTQWSRLADLMVEAGVMTCEMGKKGDGPTYAVAVERMSALLALTAIHDIMKMDALLPTVQAAHAPYEGFEAGDRINDHDVALGYILEHYGSSLSSYALLPEQMRHTLRFTQVRLNFNHGWFVQAEAPPGQLLAQFKKRLVSDKFLKQSDVSFYFVHWLTDLAGAEPTPLRGSEKFVLKFPHPVLHSFISSFSIVGELVDKSETAVVESLLSSTWANASASLGPTPVGLHAIALMRLVIQVQHLPLQQGIASAWRNLPEEDQETLAFEMALTGIDGQHYDRVPPAKRKALQVGPTFLVYYSPAFIRNAARQEPEAGMRMLADIYRQARTLWPASTGQVNKSVTIRIDQIKEHTPQHLMDGYLWGEGWLLVKLNDREAVIEHHSLYMLHERADTRYRVLAFWPQAADDDDESTSAFVRELEQIRLELMFMRKERGSFLSSQPGEQPTEPLAA